ncbi:ricin-type beta-trefoil lectin domain protein [Streptomyces sp. IBSBF 2435]|uniref:ricin-type beta-trefoil lectin domain protein n=1 Tax=Streptomyces sp. IBSBF 2435 TaxID=2903531 RepID=UPI002FDBAFB0
MVAAGAALAVLTGTGAATAAGPAAAPALVPAPAAAPGVAAAPTAFVHPGVLVSRSQLDYVRAKVQAGAAPWAAAYSQMASSSYASLSRTPKPRGTVECGPYSDPDNGCTDEREDAIAAYTDALAWYISGNSAYAQESIKLMDAWSSTITGHTNSNAPLQTGWAGSVWPRAAEIIKYTYTGGWPNSGRFGTMLRNVYLPEIINGSNSNGTSAQSWTVASGGTLKALGKCLDVAAAGTANGSKVQLYDCNGTGSQVWQPGSGGSLVNPQSGKCLDATGNTSANGTKLQIWSCTGSANQSWTLPS